MMNDDQFLSIPYIQEYLAAFDLTEAVGLQAPQRLLARKDCVDLKKTRAVLLDYFERHNPLELQGQIMAIYFALVPLLFDKTQIPFNLTIGWIVRGGKVICHHDEQTIRRFLKEKLAAWQENPITFHFWLTSPAAEILDVTFAMNLGRAKNRAECDKLIVYQSVHFPSSDPVYHPTLVGPDFFRQTGAGIFGD